MTKKPTESRVEDLFADVRDNNDALLGSAERTQSDQLQVQVLAHIAELLEDTATNPSSTVGESIEAQYIVEHRLPSVRRMAGEAYEQAVDADPDARRERVEGELRQQFDSSLASMSASVGRVNHHRTGNQLVIPNVEGIEAQFEGKLSEWKASGVFDYVRAARRGPGNIVHDLVITPLTHYTIEDMLAMMKELVPEDVLDNLQNVTRKKGEINRFSSDGEGLNYPELTRDFIKQYSPDQLAPNASGRIDVRFSLVPNGNHPATKGKGITELPSVLKTLQGEFPWLREPYFLENVQTMLTRLGKRRRGEVFKGAVATSGPSFTLPRVKVASMEGVPVVMFDKIVKAGIAVQSDATGGRFSIE